MSRYRLVAETNAFLKSEDDAVASSVREEREGMDHTLSKNDSNRPKSAHPVVSLVACFTFLSLLTKYW